MVRNLHPKEALEKFLKKEAVLVDVRELDEYKAEHIPGARLHPLSCLTCSDFEHEIQPIIVHCHSGKRSQKACEAIENYLPELEIYQMEGGLQGWKMLAQGPTHIGASKQQISINRQTQILAGSLILLASILGLVINLKFFALATFVGLGLLIAGITGWCGSAQLLALMPWNK